MESISDCVFFEKEGSNYIVLTSEDFGLKVFDTQGKLVSKIADDQAEEFNGFSAVTVDLLNKNFVTCSKHYSGEGDHYPV